MGDHVFDVDEFDLVTADTGVESGLQKRLRRRAMGLDRPVIAPPEDRRLRPATGTSVFQNPRRGGATKRMFKSIFVRGRR